MSEQHVIVENKTSTRTGRRPRLHLDQQRKEEAELRASLQLPIVREELAREKAEVARLSADVVKLRTDLATAAAPRPKTPRAALGSKTRGGRSVLDLNAEPIWNPEWARQ
jgi:hypothetical protein